MHAKMDARWAINQSKAGFSPPPHLSSFENVAGMFRLETGQTDQEYLGDPQVHLNSQQSNSVQTHKRRNSFDRFPPKDGSKAAP